MRDRTEPARREGKEINVQLARQRPEKVKKPPKEKKPKAEPAPKIDPKDLPLSTTGLFIGGLPKTYTTEDLTKDFTKFGELADAFGMPTDTYGFICFALMS